MGLCCKEFKKFLNSIVLKKSFGMAFTEFEIKGPKRIYRVKGLKCERPIGLGMWCWCTENGLKKVKLAVRFGCG